VSFTYGQFEQTLVQALGLMTSETVIIANQNAPRPSLPYFTVQLLSFNALGEPEEIPGGGVFQTVNQWSELTVQVKAVGADAFSRAFACKEKLGLREFADSLFKKGAGLARISSVLDLPATRQNGIEQQAVFDVAFNVATETSEDVSYIDDVEATGTIESQTVII